MDAIANFIELCHLLLYFVAGILYLSQSSLSWYYLCDIIVFVCCNVSLWCHNVVSNTLFQLIILRVTIHT